MKNSISTVSNTGFKGIIYRKDRNRFYGYISISYKKPGTTNELYSKTIWTKTFKTRQEAIKARVEFINSLY